MANGAYNRGLYEILTGATVWGTSDLRALLVKSTYTFDKTHNVVADVIAGSLELSVAGYARVALTSEAVTEDDSNNRAYGDADDVTFGPLTAGQTVGGMIIFRHTGSDATAPVIGFYDVSPDYPTNGVAFVVQYTAPGSGGAMYLYQP